jgi:hypothetical protein
MRAARMTFVRWADVDGWQKEVSMSEVSNANAPANRALDQLRPFVGRWKMEIRWSEKTHKLVGGPAVVHSPVTFTWIEGGCFLVHHMSDDDSPTARWIIGADETSGAFALLYADARGVSRIYQMALDGGAWKIWRDSPGFHQRFLGRLSPDQNTIEASWEKSLDGVTWELDFELRYTKSH